MMVSLNFGTPSSDKPVVHIVLLKIRKDENK